MATTTTYSSEFYRLQSEGSARSAEQIVPLLIELIGPRSVVDVGCGVASWLRAFEDRGVSDVLGVDGSWVDRTALRIIPERFREVDLAKPFTLPRCFDVAISLEVAEHLPPEAAPGFVDSLVSLAPVVVFSAAVPHQGGVNHLNEQWPDYWAALFAERGFRAVDCIRRRVWDNPNVQFWYAQNLLVFVRERHLTQLPLLEAAAVAPALPMRVIHPRKYEQAVALYEEATRGQRSDGSFTRLIAAAWRRLARPPAARETSTTGS